MSVGDNNCRRNDGVFAKTNHHDKRFDISHIVQFFEFNVLRFIDHSLFIEYKN